MILIHLYDQYLTLKTHSHGLVVAVVAFSFCTTTCAIYSAKINFALTHTYTHSITIQMFNWMVWLRHTINSTIGEFEFMHTFRHIAAIVAVIHSLVGILSHFYEVLFKFFIFIFSFKSGFRKNALNSVFINLSFKQKLSKINFPFHWRFHFQIHNLFRTFCYFFFFHLIHI